MIIRPGLSSVLCISWQSVAFHSSLVTLPASRWRLSFHLCLPMTPLLIHSVIITCHKYEKNYLERKDFYQHSFILGKHCCSGKLRNCFQNIKILEDSAGKNTHSWTQNAWKENDVCYFQASSSSSSLFLLLLLFFDVSCPSVGSPPCLSVYLLVFLLRHVPFYALLWDSTLLTYKILHSVLNILICKFSSNIVHFAWNHHYCKSGVWLNLKILYEH